MEAPGKAIWFPNELLNDIEVVRAEREDEKVCYTVRFLVKVGLRTYTPQKLGTEAS